MSLALKQWLDADHDLAACMLSGVFRSGRLVRYFNLGSQERTAKTLAGACGVF